MSKRKSNANKNSNKKQKIDNELDISWQQPKIYLTHVPDELLENKKIPKRISYENINENTKANKRQKIDNEFDISWAADLPDELLETESMINQEDVPDELLDTKSIENQEGGRRPFPFEITRIRSDDVPDFEINNSLYEINSLLEPMSFSEALTSLDNFFEEVHRRFVLPLKDNQKIHLLFNNSELAAPISIGYLKKKDMTSELIASEFERVAQSFKFQNEDETPRKHKFSLKVSILNNKIGGRRTNTKIYSDADDFVENHPTIINYNNTDEMCLLYSILIGKQIWDNPSTERWAKNDPKIDKTLLKVEAQKIKEKLNLNSNKKMDISVAKIIVYKYQKSSSISFNSL